MKIIILTTNYPRRDNLYNGIFIHQQVKALQQLGAECHVVLLHNWYPPLGLHALHRQWKEGHAAKQVFFEEYEGVKIHSVPMFVRMPGRLFKDNYYDRAARAVAKCITHNAALAHPDWLYAHFLTEAGFIGSKVKDLLNVKLAAIARGDDVHAWPEEKPELRRNLKIVFAKADLLLANSKALAADTRKWMEPGLDKDVKVAYNGVDVDMFRPTTSPAERDAICKRFNLDPACKYLICVGLPIALKGWNELLEAIKILGDELEGWKLLMIAPIRTNADNIDLKQKGIESGISDHLIYCGTLPFTDMPAILQASDMFILPSYNEGMANSLLEAMATGLPCIATNVGGHPEVIESDSEGILVTPRSVTEIVAALRKLLPDNKLRETMGLNARKKMMALGDYQHNAKKLLELL